MSPTNIMNKMYRIPSAEHPSPIIINTLLSYMSARTPAGTDRIRVGRNPSSVTSAICAALPVLLKMYTPSPKLVRPPPIWDMRSPDQSMRNLK